MVALLLLLLLLLRAKGAITSKIKHAINHKTSPAIAQLLQPSPLDGTHWTVRRHWLQAKTKC